MTRKFSDLGVKTTLKHFIGEKIKISKILNKEIVVVNYSIQPSKIKGDYAQIQIEIDKRKHVLFTGSTVLIQTLDLINKNDFPFSTVIIEENEHYEFT